MFSTNGLGVMSLLALLALIGVVVVALKVPAVMLVVDTYGRPDGRPVLVGVKSLVLHTKPASLIVWPLPSTLPLANTFVVLGVMDVSVTTAGATMKFAVSVRSPVTVKLYGLSVLTEVPPSVQFDRA